MNVWWQALLAAAASGAASALAAHLVDPTHFSDPAHLASIVLGGALVGVANFLKQSPLPKGS